MHKIITYLLAGYPLDTTTTLGPLSSESAVIGLLAQVKVAVKHGATIALGGKRIDRKGAYMEPTILMHVTKENPAFRDEFFGPVAMFFRVKYEDEAIAIANDSAPEPSYSPPPEESAPPPPPPSDGDD